MSIKSSFYYITAAGLVLTLVVFTIDSICELYNWAKGVCFIQLWNAFKNLLAIENSLLIKFYGFVSVVFTIIRIIHYEKNKEAKQNEIEPVILGLILFGLLNSLTFYVKPKIIGFLNILF